MRRPNTQSISLAALFVSGPLLLAGCTGTSGESGSTETDPSSDTGTASSSASGTATGAARTVTSKSGTLQLTLTTTPEPPPRGLFDADLLITENNVGVESLTISVTPYMPSMGHGTNKDPVIEAKGGGHYAVTGINAFMAGVWELRIALSGARTDEAVFTLDIP